MRYNAVGGMLLAAAQEAAAKSMQLAVKHYAAAFAGAVTVGNVQPMKLHCVSTAAAATAAA
jgi:hypothetical protein